MLDAVWANYGGSSAGEGVLLILGLVALIAFLLGIVILRAVLRIDERVKYQKQMAQSLATIEKELRALRPPAEPTRAG